MKNKVHVTEAEQTALDESIKVWVGKVATRDGDKVPLGAENCPCCLAAPKRSSGAVNCADCAICKDGHVRCIDTPYVRVASFYPSTMTPTLRTLCMDELNYLRDLRERCTTESEFEVGDYAYSKAKNMVVKVTEPNRCIAVNRENVAEGAFLYQEDFIPFYAPPTPEQLKEWGMEIDRVGVPSEGDCIYNRKAHMEHLKYGITEHYNGLRYILKPVKRKFKVVEVDANEPDRIKRVIGEVEVNPDNMTIKSTEWYTLKI